MIVVDVNILLYYLVAGERTADARALYERDADWIAPELLSHELLNVLATWGKKDYLGVHDCLKTWRQAQVMMEDRLAAPDMELALNLALKHRITAYDAQYVAVAHSRDLVLVTEDQELLKKLPRIAKSMDEFLNS